MDKNQLQLLSFKELLEELRNRVPDIVVAYRVPLQDGGQEAGVDLHWWGDVFACYGLAHHLIDVIKMRLALTVQDITEDG